MTASNEVFIKSLNSNSWQPWIDVAPNLKVSSQQTENSHTFQENVVVKFWCCFVNYKAVTAQSFTYHHNLCHGNALRNASLRCFISRHRKINISILVVIRIQGPCPLSSGLGPLFIVDDPSDANIQSKFENTTLYLSCPRCLVVMCTMYSCEWYCFYEYSIY